MFSNLFGLMGVVLFRLDFTSLAQPPGSIEMSLWSRQNISMFITIEKLWIAKLFFDTHFSFGHGIFL
jgi:hypothetical protein